ncbi:Dual specificity phosphatase [Nymphaea thermarum]|nr:Dual specificity phosphatase [Nymphaea thermarum]
MARALSYISPAQLLAIQHLPKVAVIDVRDEERKYDGHIAGSLHVASGSFSENLPSLLAQVKAKDTVVFHCALSQVRGPSCARKFARYLENVNDDINIKEIMILEGGFNRWSDRRRPVCRCSEVLCKGGSS